MKNFNMSIICNLQVQLKMLPKITLRREMQTLLQMGLQVASCGTAVGLGVKQHVYTWIYSVHNYLLFVVA